MPATRPRSTRSGAPSSRASRMSRTAPTMDRPGSGGTGRSSPMANWSRRSTATGRRSRPISARRSRPASQPAAAEISDERVQQAARDSVRAIMMIRAYRMRGHFYAHLDPLGPRAAQDRIRPRPGLLRLHRGRLRPEDLHRPRARARVRHHPGDARHPPADLLRHARHRVHAHLRPGREELDPGADRRPGQGHRLHARRARRRSSTSSPRPKASRSSSTSSIPAPSASASTAAKSLIPALEQIIKRGGQLGVQRDRARHGPSRPAQRARPR